MKRLNNLYSQIYNMENLQLADQIARKGKLHTYGVKLHDKNREDNIIALYHMLRDKTYRTSTYKVFKIWEPKERDVYGLPYFPDRITHHAVMNILEPIFVSTFTADSYSCIKGKGIHAATYAVREALKDRAATTYCLKLDVKKFYPSIDHDILKSLLRRKFKDNELLWLLDEIIESAPGVPIGNYLSQYFSNYYLTPFDHWIKEGLRVKYYFRYLDDMVILSDNKPYLHELLYKIMAYLGDNLKLTVKKNYQVFKVEDRGIDFVGYRKYHRYVLLRKSIKKRMARAYKKPNNRASIAAYHGWAVHCNSAHLIKKLTNEEVRRI
jgi:RNA-directed DNA polymerase